MPPATRTDEPHAATKDTRPAPPAPHPDDPHHPSKDPKAEPKESAEPASQTEARKLATGLANPLAPAAHTDLPHFTFAYEAHCAEILGIGHPIGGADLYELTMRDHEGAIITILVPRTFEDASTFSPGSFYCEPLVDGQPVKPIAIYPAGVFHKLTGTTPGGTGATGTIGTRRESGPQPQGAQGHPSTIKT